MGKPNAPILHIMPSTVGGGAEEVAMRIATHQLDHFEVHVAHWDANPFESDRIQFHHISFNSKSILKPIYIFVSIAKLVWMLKPRAVISHLTYTNVITFWASQIRSTTKRIMVHHSTTIPDWSPIPSWFLRRAYSSSGSRLIAVGKQTGALLTESLSLREDKILVLPNPLKLPPFLTESTAPEGKVRLIAVGRIAAVKNYPFLLETMGALPDKFTLTIFGDGERSALESQVQVLGISHRVRFAGTVTKEALYEAFGAHDALVMTSDLEGQPSAVLEAAASGLPVFGRATPGLFEAIEKVGGDALATQDTPENLATLLVRKLATDRVLVRKQPGNWIKLHDETEASHEYCKLITT